MKIFCKKHGVVDLVFYADKEIIKQQCEHCCKEFLEKLKLKENKIIYDKIDLKKNRSKEVEIYYKNKR